MGGLRSLAHQKYDFCYIFSLKKYYTYLEPCLSDIFYGHQIENASTLIAATFTDILTTVGTGSQDSAILITVNGN